MKQLSFFLPVLFIISCNQQTKQDAPNANVDSLTSAFVAGWNNKDSAAILKWIDDAAIVINDSILHNGYKAIADHWISGGVKVISNVKTTSLRKGGDGNTTYDAGTYTLDVTPPGNPVIKEIGNYSFVWTRNKDGQWKLIVIHIADITKAPDIK